MATFSTEGLPFEAYKGSDPYIFVSYSHRDLDSVYAVIANLKNQGYRIWYDEGIDPGNEWPDEVAQALAKCGQFLVFISPNSVDSPNVRNEINFAINRAKPFVAVHLVESVLPPGLELRMGDIQAIMKFRMDDEDFFRKLQKSLPKTFMQGSISGKPEVAGVLPRADVSVQQGRPTPKGAVFAIFAIVGIILGVGLFAIRAGPEAAFQNLKAIALRTSVRVDVLDSDGIQRSMGPGTLLPGDGFVVTSFACISEGLATDTRIRIFLYDLNDSREAGIASYDVDLGVALLRMTGSPPDGAGMAPIEPYPVLVGSMPAYMGGIDPKTGAFAFRTGSFVGIDSLEHRRHLVFEFPVQRGVSGVPMRTKDGKNIGMARGVTSLNPGINPVVAIPMEELLVILTRMSGRKFR